MCDGTSENLLGRMGCLTMDSGFVLRTPRNDEKETYAAGCAILSSLDSK
jgi:hypothetical protein